MSQILDRFYTKIELKESGLITDCWNWIGCVDKQKGYGRFTVKYTQSRLIQLAHRFSFMLFKGFIQEGLTIDHLCKNRKCVNPDHLEAVTNKENILRGNGHTAINSRKIECINGHVLLGDNLYINKTSGSRQCRICQKESCKNFYKKNPNYKKNRGG